MLYVRPLWSFSVAMLAIFLGCTALGVWQVQRLHWKLQLITQVNRNLTLPAIPVERALTAGIGEMQYRHVSLHGRFLNEKEAYVFAPGENGTANYHVITPFVLADGQVLLVDRGMVPERLREAGARPEGLLQGERDMTGVLRVPEGPGIFTPSPNLQQRVWYARDVKGIAEAYGLRVAAPVLVEADATLNPGGWPKGGQTVVTFHNDHLQYAITWFALAAVTLGGWIAFHVSRGRLGWRR